MPRLLALLLCLCVSVLAQTVTISEAERDPLNYRAPLTPLGRQAAPTPPLWQDERDPLDLGNTALGFTPTVTDGVNLYYLKRGQLIAADPSTGQRRWKYGAGLGPALAVNLGLVAVGGADGRVHALEAYSETRKLRWVAKSGLKGVRHLFVQGDVYASQGNQVVAFRGDGRRRWSAGRGDTGQVVAVSGPAVLYKYTQSGAITTDNFAALNALSGALLWERGGVLATLLGEEPGTLAIHTSGPPVEPGPDYGVEFVEARSGEIRGRLSVRVPATEGCPNPVVTNALLNAESLWLDVRDGCGEYPVRFLRNSPQVPLVYNNFAQETAWLAGPSGDRIFITTQIGDGRPACLQGLSLTSRDTVFYDTGCGTVASLTIAGGGLYVGLADGRWLAFDLRSGEGLLRARLNARAFGPTLVLGGAAVVQAEGQLVGFALPPRLR